MPVEYPVEQLMADMMATIPQVTLYVIPAAIFIAFVAFILRWFFYAINLGDLVFGSRR